MGKSDIIQTRSYDFALKIIFLYQHLAEKKREFVLSKQVLRSATSIGANVEEAVGAQSIKDFVTKLTIALKESRETIYWLRLLTDSGYLEISQSVSLIQEAREISLMLGKSIVTTRQKYLTSDRDSGKIDHH